MMDKLQDAVKKLKENDTLLLVEGKKDKMALQAFGMRNVQILDRPLFEVIEGITGECAVLTDFDKKGKELYGKLANQLRQRGVKVDDSFRNLLMTLPLKQIEGLPAVVHKIYKSPRHQLEW